MAHGPGVPPLLGLPMTAWSDGSPTPLQRLCGRSWRVGCRRLQTATPDAVSSVTLALASTGTTPVPTRRRRFWEDARRQFGEYMENPCVHGLKYIGRSDYPASVRALWALFFAASVVSLVVLVHEQSFSSPMLTKVSVVSTRVPSDKYPFPSVTVCPQHSILKSIGISILRIRAAKSGQVGANATAQDAMFVRLMRALQDFRFPLYTKTWASLDVEALRYIGELDVRHLLLQTFPSCREVFGLCRWGDDVMHCCQLFTLQETNAGFCYSFNSCTDVDRKFQPCTPQVGLPNDKGGLLVGTAVALESELLDADVGLRGVTVIVSDPYEMPQPSNGFFLREDRKTIAGITVSLTAQDADDSVRQVPWQSRGCKFIDEHPLSISMHYSQQSCMENCRTLFLAEHCGCIPFHYDIRGSALHENAAGCNATGLECVFNSKHAQRLLNSVPLRTVREVAGLQLLVQAARLDCQCPPVCTMLKYQSELSDLGTTSGTPYSDKKKGSVVFIHQKNVAARNIQYQMSIQYTFAQFLADLGNIAALFLGVSILSVFEFIAVSVSCLCSLYRSLTKPMPP